jgi:hypothetical protein
MTILSSIPNYEDDIRRMMRSEEIDFSKALNSMLKAIFNAYIPESLLQVIQIMLWVVLICFVAWIIYKEFGQFYHDTDFVPEERHNFSATELGSAEDADIRGHNFVQEIQQAISEGNYPRAIHLRYLMTLQRLDTLRLISWQPYKTPMMYVREMPVDAPKLKDITMTFLYIKYGHYPADQTIFDEVTTIYNALCALKAREEVSHDE